MSGPFEDDSTADVRTDSSLIIVPKPPETRFYQLRGCAKYEISNVEIDLENLVLHYRATLDSEAPR